MGCGGCEEELAEETSTRLMSVDVLICFHPTDGYIETELTHDSSIA